MKKKKIIQTLAIALSILSISALTTVNNSFTGKMLTGIGLSTQEANAATTVTAKIIDTLMVGSVRYAIMDNGEAEVFRAWALVGDVTIPEKVTYNSVDYPVTSVGSYAFISSFNTYYDANGHCNGVNQPNSNITTTAIILPSSVKVISEYAFYMCNALKTVTMPGVTYIGNYAFSSTTVTDALILPSTLTTIGNSAFNGCGGQTKFDIPESVTSIGTSAFTTVVTSGSAPIRYFENYSTYGLPRNTTFTYLGDKTLNGMVFSYTDATMSTLTLVASETTALSGSVNIPSDVNGIPVVAIGANALKGCVGITSVTMPNSVTSIGASAFANCTGLVGVTLSNAVITVGNYAFQNCTSISSIIIPNSVTSLGIGVFYNCSSIPSIVIPESVTTIGSQVLYGCAALKVLSVAKDTQYTALAPGTFNASTFLDDLGNVKQILYSKSTAGELASYVHTPVIAGKTFNKWVNTTTNVPVTNFPSTSTASYTGKFVYALDVIENGVVYRNIGSSYSVAFSTINNIVNLDIAKTINGLPVTSIDSKAFYNCAGLTSVTIPDSVTSIGANAFYGCPVNMGSAPVKFSGTVGLPRNTTFNYVGDVTRNGISYKYTDSTNTALEVTRATNLGLSGDVIIPSSIDGVPVVSIGANALTSCTVVTSVTIPESIESIGGSAFTDCIALTSIAIPDSVKSIGAYAFQGCTAMTSITIPDSVTSFNSTWIANDTSLSYAKVSSNALSSAAAITNYMKVYFVGEDEATSLGAAFVKVGSSAYGIVTAPVQADYTFLKWVKASTASTSIIGNIQDNVTFVASYKSTPGTLGAAVAVADQTLTLNKTITTNRDSLVVGTLGNKTATAKYYYTLDGTAPSASNGTLISGTTFSIPVQDTDLEKTLNIKVIGTESGLTSSKVSTALVTFLAGSATVLPEITKDGITYQVDTDNKLIIKSGVGLTGNVVIPAQVDGHAVKAIGYEALKDCTGITSVEIPITVTRINGYAFKGCIGLTSISIPSSVTSLYGSTFEGCTSLATAYLPSTMTSLTSSDFTNCISLESIRGSFSLVKNNTLTGYNKVNFMSDDESTMLSSWYVKSGVSMVGKEVATVKPNYTFSKWTRYTTNSISLLADVEDNVTFQAQYISTPGTLGEGISKVASPIITASSRDNENRKVGITVQVS